MALPRPSFRVNYSRPGQPGEDWRGHLVDQDALESKSVVRSATASNGVSRCSTGLHAGTATQTVVWKRARAKLGPRWYLLTSLLTLPLTVISIPSRYGFTLIDGRHRNTDNCCQIEAAALQGPAAGCPIEQPGYSLDFRHSMVQDAGRTCLARPRRTCNGRCT
jgi:hypothetical protein